MATTFKKDPNATLDYEFDWSAWLLPMPDTIVSVTWIVSAGLVVVSNSFTTLTATAFVSGGVLDTTEILTCRITTAGGRIDDRSVNLKIVSR